MPSPQDNLENSVGLYKSDENFSGWKEIITDPADPFNVVKIPCN